MIRSLAAFLAFSAVSASACTIPVFRYALDRWEPDYFMLEFPKDDPAAAEVRKTLEKSAANLDITTGDVSAARLLFPQHQGGTPWPDPIDPRALGGLLDSPLRKEIAKRITGGDSAVWVVVEDGDAKAAAEARAKLEERLKYLESVASLPEQDPMDPSSQLAPGPELAVRFSLLTVKRDDPAEKALIRMLEAGLEEEERAKAQPVAYPVFGRGRVLAALPSAQWTPETLDEVALFLLGACSCQVKELNPGWDILMDVAWDDALQAAAEAREKGEATAGAGTTKPAETPAAPQPETVVLSGSSADQPAAASGGGWLAGRGTLVGGVLLACALLGGLVWARSRKGTP